MNRRGEQLPWTKLTARQVKQIRAMCADGTITRKEIAQRFGIHVRTVSKIAARETWRHV